MKYYALFLCLALLSACMGREHVNYLKIRNISEPSAENFIHCYNYGCSKRVELALPQTTIKKLNNLFSPPSNSKELERTRIGNAIQIFEEDVGALAQTQHDVGGTFKLYQRSNVQGRQQDCIDESTNTTIYLTLLEQLDLLKFYEPAFTANRQPFFGGSAWWHQTAAIKDRETDERFAVDSWFKDNGHPAYVVPYKKWKNGWRPSP